MNIDAGPTPLQQGSQINQDQVNQGSSRRDCLKGFATLAAAALAASGAQPAWGQEKANVTSAAPGPGGPKPVPNFAYVGCRTTKERNARGEGINVYKVDPASGGWTHVQLLEDLVNPSFLAFDSTQRFLFTVHGDFGEVSAFAVDQSTGQLTLLNQQSCGGKNPVHLTVDPTDKFLLVANYATGSLSVLPIGPDGRLGAVADLVTLAGDPGPHRVEQASSHPHHIPYDPKKGFLIVPDKGLDRIFTYRFDAAQGKLLPSDPPSLPSRAGAGPRHIAFHPSAPFAYVVNELESTVTAYGYDDAKGALEPKQILPVIPATYTGNNRAAGIGITPDGRFVYASNRGQDHLAIFAVDPTNGMLSSVGWESTQGKMPRFFTIDPSGSFFYAANEATDTIVGFRIDPSTGKLTSIGKVAQTGSPVCIIFSTV